MHISVKSGSGVCAAAATIHVAANRKRVFGNTKLTANPRKSAGTDKLATSPVRSAHKMARLYPALLPTRAMTAGQYRERDVLERLELALPEGYEIFHNVDWHSLHEGEDRHGEIDVIVMNRAGALLLLEIKAGQVSFTESRISKQYGAEAKQVDAQLRRQYAAMLGRLKNAGIFTPVKSETAAAQLAQRLD
jgi:hypothetical protein